MSTVTGSPGSPGGGTGSTVRMVRDAVAGGTAAGSADGTAGEDVPLTRGTVEAALVDDGSGLRLTSSLARVIDQPYAGADGHHLEEPSPFGDGDLVGTVSAVCAVARLRPDCGQAGLSAIHKEALDGPVAVNGLGIIVDQQGDHAHHGGRDKALYAMSAPEQRHWSHVLGGVAPGALGENLLVEGDIDDVELGAVLRIGGVGRRQGGAGPAGGVAATDQAGPEPRYPGGAEPTGPVGTAGPVGPVGVAGVTVRVTGVRNPCATFARGVGREDWVEVFSSRNRVGVYLAVLTEGTVQAGDEARVVSSPGHGVTCRRWFAHHDPRDAACLLQAEEEGRCVLPEFTRKYVRAALREHAQ